MTHCCDSFDELVSLQGERGFSIEPPNEASPLPERQVHQIVFRAFDHGRGEEVRIDSPYPVDVEGGMGFRFCPWCGTPVEPRDRPPWLRRWLARWPFR